MRYCIYSTSEKAWQGMLESIESARDNVYMEMYILDDDSKGSLFFNALERAVARGVKVIVILDIVGSLKIFGHAVGRLREKGGEVIFCSYFFKRLHKKTLIVDEKVAFVGGVNIGRKFAGWPDLQIRISGRVVKSVLRSFIRSYKKCGGSNLLAKRHPEKNHWKRTRLWFVDHGIGKRSHLLQEHYAVRIDRARQSIVLVTPYLLPPLWLISGLHQALIRGVKVKILLPESSDYLIADSINRYYASFFTRLGTRCYFMPGMNHAKAMIIDSKEGIIGSQNLDRLTFNWNIEAGVFFTNHYMIRDLTAIINAWKSKAEIFSTDSPNYKDRKRHGKSHWYDIPIALFLRLLGFVPLE